MKQSEYRETYLRSKHWRETRKGALERAGHRCQVCNGTKRLDVHHRTYERIGAELPADLTVLCRGCHDLFHNTRKVGRRARAKPKTPVRVTASKEEARERLRAVLQQLDPHRTYRTSDIALLASMSASSAGGFIAGFARRGEYIRRVKRKYWQAV